MNRPLNKNEIEFLLFHLNMFMDIKVLGEVLQYTDDAHGKFHNKVIIPSHKKGLSPATIEGIPILFASMKAGFYSIDENANLVFHHDLLKSAFYLLSGYHEHYENQERDKWGRVKYEGSIQQQLGIIHRPVVNEYFQVLLKGINAFLKHHGQPTIHQKKLFQSFGFLLSHDIDVIDKYGWPHLGYKIKELTGLAKSTHTKKQLLRATITSFFQFIHPYRKNPYWNFSFLIDLEKKHHIKASYYFLSPDKKGGSRYQLNESRLMELYQHLQKENHEIGIHGTTQTMGNPNLLKSEIKKLEDAAGVKVAGGRQHRLFLDLKKTFKIHADIGLKYDSSYGFAEHEGFRNSFCLPFKPYDFEKQKMVDIWQFPLMVMDVTLFNYRKMNNEAALEAVNLLISEVKKHHGIFTLLWHNSFFDEELYPGITSTYEKILFTISKEQPRSITGKSLLDLLNFYNEN